MNDWYSKYDRYVARSAATTLTFSWCRQEACTDDAPAELIDRWNDHSNYDTTAWTSIDSGWQTCFDL